ncbi:hypothetical protein Gogos_015130 [Gossypium gossypioides]|uniref:Uncharacterized protein n=1 Tax=Gossypium gossypioides TaxID=34282 RepID=A0A7J9C0W8_GOSGO|nr:hypothetical protein [Gossypium gossypioides]
MILCTLWKSYLQGPTFFKGEHIPMDVAFKPWVPHALESIIASFDSSLPQVVRMNCRRNHEDELKGI